VIHSTTAGGKFRRLVRRLRPMLPDPPVAVETIAVGILERLWHNTAVGSPRGDIGRFDNEELAEMVGWHKDAEELVAVLTDERWLDPHPTHRLLVHDWHEHAPRHVKANVAKVGGFYATESGTISAQGDALPLPEIRTAPPNEPKATPSDTKEATPNRTEPNLTQPNPTDRTIGGAAVRPDGRDEVGLLPKDPILVGQQRWRESQPVRERIARVVSGDPSVDPRKLRRGDYELCIKAAAISMWGGVDPDWLDGVIRSMSTRRTPLENRWAFFKGALIKAAARVGKDYHELEARIVIPDRQLPAPTAGIPLEVAT
jgi:hypothetical protein